MKENANSQEENKRNKGINRIYMVRMKVLTIRLMGNKINYSAKTSVY
jgi:hypothetical protein